MNAIQDPLTGESFIPARKNQRFASAANRIEFNNQKAANARDEEQKLLRPLLNNRNILSELIKPQETKSISKDYLAGRGYSLNHFTHIEVFEGQSVLGLFEFLFIKRADPLTIMRTK